MRKINRKQKDRAKDKENSEHNCQQGNSVDTTSEEAVPASDSEYGKDSNPITNLRNHTPR